MAAYFIADVDVTDPESFEQYRAQVGATIEKYGGKYLVRGGAFEKIEGDWTPTRMVILEFESMERAREWYHSEDYKDIMALRHRSANTSAVLVEGL